MKKKKGREDIIQAIPYFSEYILSRQLLCLSCACIHISSYIHHVTASVHISMGYCLESCHAGFAVRFIVGLGKLLMDWMLEEFFFISIPYSYFVVGCGGVFINTTAIHLLGRMFGLEISIT